MAAPAVALTSNKVPSPTCRGGTCRPAPDTAHCCHPICLTSWQLCRASCRPDVLGGKAPGLPTCRPGGIKRPSESSNPALVPCAPATQLCVVQPSLCGLNPQHTHTQALHPPTNATMHAQEPPERLPLSTALLHFSCWTKCSCTALLPS